MFVEGIGSCEVVGGGGGGGGGGNDGGGGGDRDGKEVGDRDLPDLLLNNLISIFDSLSPPFSSPQFKESFLVEGK